MIFFRAQPTNAFDQGPDIKELVAARLAANLNGQKLSMNCPYHPGKMTVIDILPTFEIKFEVSLCCCKDFGEGVLELLNSSKKSMR